MRRVLHLTAIVLLCGALACPSIEARGRNNSNSTNATHQTPSRPNNAGGNNQHPGNKGNNQRPGNNGNNQRPGNNGNVKPGNNNRPGNNLGPAHNNNHPGNNFGPGHNNNHPGNNHGPKPGHGHNRPMSVHEIPHFAPHRPLMMPPRPFARPVPPAAFRPGPRYPVISTILGVTIGTAINITLDHLFNQGYYVTGYTNDAVYLNDVRQLNMIWPNATLYYDRGRLAGSEFVYSQPYYDTSRYYLTYNALCNAYGAPIVRNNLAGGGFECSWFGNNGSYVTLQFVHGIANNGTSRYFTNLMFGI